MAVEIKLGRLYKDAAGWVLRAEEEINRRLSADGSEWVMTYRMLVAYADKQENESCIGNYVTYYGNGQHISRDPSYDVIREILP